MKKTCLSLFFTALFVSLIGPAQVPAYTVDLVLSDSTIIAGDSFTMEVWVNDATIYLDPPNNTFMDEIFAFGFDIVNMNPTIVGFDSYSIGPSFLFDVSSNYSETDVAGMAIPGISQDYFLLATLTFTAFLPGDAVLGIASDMSDMNEGLGYFYSGNGEISATGEVTVSAVPIPGTMLLLGSGLAGVAGLRRRLRRR